MQRIDSKTLTALALAVALLSWYGSAHGIGEFLAGEEGRPSPSVAVIAAVGSILIQALLAVFATVSLSPYVVHVRTRVLYLAGAATMMTLSSVLAIAFWVERADLDTARSGTILEMNRDVAEAVLIETGAALDAIVVGIDVTKAEAEANATAESATGQGTRFRFWTRHVSHLDIAAQSLGLVIDAVQDGQVAVRQAQTQEELTRALNLALAPVAAQTVTATLLASLAEERARQETLASGGGHVPRWETFLPALTALEQGLGAFAAPEPPEMAEDRFAGNHGAKVYALELAQKIVGSGTLTGAEWWAVILAVLTDLVFATLLILRLERNRPGLATELKEIYGADVEALKARLARNGVEGGIAAVVRVLQTNGAGFLGFDRAFGLVVTASDAKAKTAVAQTIGFLKSEGMAHDVSAVAAVAARIGLTAAPVNAAEGKARGPVTVIVPPALWRLLNRYKTVEDSLPLPEGQGTLADFVAEQRRKRSRLFSKTLVATLDRYFASAMETRIEDLVPARIERIVEAYRGDTRVKRLARPTREKHEAAFRDVLDILRNEGRLPTGRLRVAS